jgi:glycogen debranching enzyme
LDEGNVTHQYYIATRSSPNDDRTRVLKYGKMFAVFDRHGDIGPAGRGEEGIFFQGTRFLSELVVYLWDSRPLLLSSTIKADNFVFTADLANMDLSRNGQIVVPRDTLHMLRSKFLWQGVCYEEFKIVNHGLTPLVVPMRIEVGADFADIFEVRGSRRQRRGRRLADSVQQDFVVLAYEGLDGVVRQTRIQCEPAPKKTSGSDLFFEVSLRPKEKAVFHLAISASTDPRTPVHALGYSRAMAVAHSEMKAASSDLCRISSSNNRFNEWIKRSVADIEMMTLGNPEIDYPYAGVPWFSTVFGRDGIITALELLWGSPWIAKGVLQYLASTQARELKPEVEAEPGKILHEMQNGEMAALGEVPFGRYYGSVDATPLFIILAAAHYERTGDRDLLERLWPNIQLALEWIDKYGDVDGDGFVEYAAHSNKGLLQQGWKDSRDSVFHADGTLAEPPITLCEVQGYVYAAKLAAARLHCALGNPEKSSALEAEAARLRGKFEEAFWCEDLSTYALALDGRKKPCRVRSSNAGHCLYAGIATPEKARFVAQSLLGEDFFTGWGVRTLGSAEARYNPISYHNGSVWPHDNALIASGLAKYGFKHLAGKILLGLLDVSSAVDLHRLPELFCGLERREGEGPTLYPVACAPQAWAAASVFLLVESCLGISIQSRNKQVLFDQPYLPEGIPQLTIKGLRIGNASMDLFLERHANTVQVQVLEKQGDIEVKVNELSPSIR